MTIHNRSHPGDAFYCFRNFLENFKQNPVFQIFFFAKLLSKYDCYILNSTSDHNCISTYVLRLRASRCSEIVDEIILIVLLAKKENWKEK